VDAEWEDVADKARPSFREELFGVRALAGAISASKLNLVQAVLEPVPTSHIPAAHLRILRCAYSVPIHFVPVYAHLHSPFLTSVLRLSDFLGEIGSVTFVMQ